MPVSYAQHEVDLCRRECPFVIKPKVQRPPAAATAAAAVPEGEDMETDMEGEERDGKGGAAPPGVACPPPDVTVTPVVTDVAMESSPGPSAETRQDPASAAAPSPRGGRCHRTLGDTLGTALGGGGSRCVCVCVPTHRF